MPPRDEGVLTSYANSGEKGVTMCAPNYYCQVLENAGAKFNNRINRYAKSPAFQNESEDVPESELDTIGFGARMLGRPFSYNGQELLIDDNNNMLSNFSANFVDGICLPGKSVSDFTNNETFIKRNNLEPTQRTGDKLTGQGMTSESINTNKNYLTMCPTFDTDPDGGFGNYFYKQEPEYNLGETDSEIYKKTIEQVTTTNMIGIFEGRDFIDENEILLKDYDQRHITEFVHDKNKCLRLPGSVCHSNLDCASNEKITNLTRIIDAVNNDDFNGIDSLNRYEIEFWQSTLICSQPYAKRS